MSHILDGPVDYARDEEPDVVAFISTPDIQQPQLPQSKGQPKVIVQACRGGSCR